MSEVFALFESLSDSKHTEQKKKHVKVDGFKGVKKSYLPCGKDRYAPAKHYLPDAQTKTPDMPYGDQDKNHSEDDD
jgi:hypothetical protein